MPASLQVQFDYPICISVHVNEHSFLLEYDNTYLVRSDKSLENSIKFGGCHVSIILPEVANCFSKGSFRIASVVF